MEHDFENMTDQEFEALCEKEFHNYQQAFEIIKEKLEQEKEIDYRSD